MFTQTSLNVPRGNIHTGTFTLAIFKSTSLYPENHPQHFDAKEQLFCLVVVSELLSGFRLFLSCNPSFMLALTSHHFPSDTSPLFGPVSPQSTRDFAFCCLCLYHIAFHSPGCRRLIQNLSCFCGQCCAIRSQTSAACGNKNPFCTQNAECLQFLIVF